jgi:hypothetical protein
MKTVILIAAVVISMNLKAQVATQPSPALKDSVLTASKKDSVLTSTISKQMKRQDTSKVCTKEVPTKSKNHKKEFFWNKGKIKNPNSFEGHWRSVEVGFNGFDKPDYSMYGGIEFMKLNQGDSHEWSINCSQVSIGLYKNYIGFVSGLGFSFNDYQFELPYTLTRGSQRTEPVLLDPENLSLTKLSVAYVQVPLLLEFQVPVNHHQTRVYINAGVVGGVKTASHTKVKYGKTKDKDHSGFNINSFKYAATARIGYDKIGLFGTYSMTPLFESGKGPELTPFTLGFSIHLD